MAVRDQTEGRWKEDVSPSLKKSQDESGIVSRRAHQVSTKETLEKGSIKDAPENGSIKEALEKGSNKEDPEKVSTKEEPEKGYTKEAPEKGLIRETLEKGSNNEDPVKGSIKEEPAKGYIKEAPEKGNIKETPIKGNIKEAQEKGFIKETQGIGFVNEAPAEGSINEAPAEGSINEAPAEGSINEAPAEGSINEAPAEGSINEAPAEGSINEAPAEGSINEAPAEGSINEAPAEGPINEAPAEGPINEAPAEGSINEAPAEGSINEAPAERSINVAPPEGSINEAPAEGPIKETQEDHIHKDRTEKLDILTNLKKDLGETHTARQLPQKSQNERGIVQHAIKGQNEHKAVSTTPMKDRFENHPVSQHTQKDEKVPGNTPDQWRQVVTEKGTTSSALQQDQEGSDAVALSLKKNQTKTEPVPHIGKTHGHRNGTAFPPFGTKHSGIATKKATNEADTKQNPRTGRGNESSSAAPPPREKERTVVLEEGGNKMEAEKMLVDSKAKPHKRAVYSLAVHRSERQVNNDDNCRCPVCNINDKFDGDFESIAYNKEVQMSSTLGGNEIPCLLVNGLTTPSISITCPITGSNDRKAFVEIDLGEAYSFEKLVVVRRNIPRTTSDIDTEVMWGLQAIVDGDICYTWADYNNRSALPAYKLTDRYNITCGHVVTGRYFRLHKRDLPGSGQRYYIILCEVYVMVCTNLTFGRNSCNMCPPDQSCKYVCNKVYGCDTLVPFNVAIKKTASMSSTLYGDASFVIDGALGDSDPHLCTATNPSVDGSRARWWQVDTGESYRIFKLHVHNRVDASEFLLGQSCAGRNEIKRCKLGHSCDNNTCSIPLGTYCKDTPDGCGTHAECDASQGHVCKISSNGPCNTTGDCAKVDSGFVCDSMGRCSLPAGTYCEDTPDGCVRHAVCDASQGHVCKMSSNGTCKTTGDCAHVISGFVCDSMGRCSLPLGTYCKKTPDDCVSHTECDASRGYVCKISSNQGLCNITGDCANVISGFVCDSMGRCNCKKHKYGPTCSDTCGRCADDKPCNSSNGNCLACLTGWTPPPICKTAVSGLITTEQIVVGVTVAVLLFWLLLAVLVALWHILYSAGCCPCIFLGHKRRKKEEDGEDAEVSLDTGPPSKWSRFRKFIGCGGAGEAFLGVLFCISCGKLLSDKFRWRKEVIQNDNEDMSTEASLHSPEKRSAKEKPDPQAVDAKHTATSKSYLKKDKLGALRSDRFKKKSENQAKFDGNRIYVVDPHHSHDLSSDQYAPLLMAVTKNIEAGRAKADQNARDPTTTILNAAIL
ncbi:uncharacterized protein [Littorina saxatilis]|uniref:uncharacterized protein isoform X2 n=1 Tax=Littorina saxatilis TaxID=31220 RepID=UPI0038B4FFA9